MSADDCQESVLEADASAGWYFYLQSRQVQNITQNISFTLAR